MAKGPKRARWLKQQRETFRRLSYHAEKLLVKNHAPEHDLAKVKEALGILLDQGLPESDPALEAPLRPLLETLEPGAEPRLARVLSYIRVRAPKGEQARSDVPGFSAEALEVARLLKGRTLVLLGGTPNAEAARKLEQAFACRVNWLESRAHQSHYDFEPDVVRPEVAAVVLLIRWSSHAFAEVSEFCRDNGKPLVRAPAGYGGVNSLAQAILEQASRQLAA